MYLYASTWNKPAAAGCSAVVWFVFIMTVFMCFEVGICEACSSRLVVLSFHIRLLLLVVELMGLKLELVTGVLAIISCCSRW